MYLIVGGRTEEQSCQTSRVLVRHERQPLITFNQDFANQPARPAVLPVAATALMLASFSTYRISRRFSHASCRDAREALSSSSTSWSSFGLKYAPESVHANTFPVKPEMLFPASLSRTLQRSALCWRPNPARFGCPWASAMTPIKPRSRTSTTDFFS